MAITTIVCFLQDGDPSQNSARACEIYDNLGATVFKIPPRSPDLNLIENAFYLVDLALHADTKRKNITQETFNSFRNKSER